MEMNHYGLSLLLLALVSLVDCHMCRYNLTEIKRSLNKSGDVDNIFLNCLAHDGTHAESISLSVSRSGANNSRSDLRYDFRCVDGSTLIPTLSNLFSNVSMANPACTACNFTAADPCVESEYVCCDGH